MYIEKRLAVAAVVLIIVIVSGILYLNHSADEPERTAAAVREVLRYTEPDWWVTFEVPCRFEDDAMQRHYHMTRELIKMLGGLDVIISLKDISASRIERLMRKYPAFGNLAAQRDDLGKVLASSYSAERIKHLTCVIIADEYGDDFTNCQHPKDWHLSD